MTLEELKKETGVTALDVAKAMLDFGIHPPTMYFPLIVHEALMVEPTETETPETLDEAAQALADDLAPGARKTRTPSTPPRSPPPSAAPTRRPPPAARWCGTPSRRAEPCMI